MGYNIIITLNEPNENEEKKDNEIKQSLFPKLNNLKPL